MESVPISRENYDYYSSAELLTEENLIKAVSEYGKNGYAMVSAIDQNFSESANYNSSNNKVPQEKILQPNLSIQT